MIRHQFPIQITCNAPMPAFPKVHMDGAAASAFANAFLHDEIYRCSSHTDLK